MRIIGLCLLLMTSFSSVGFGLNGHRIVGELAQQHLTPEAHLAVQKILDKQTLAQVSNWADEIRSDKEWKHADSWHYVSIEDNQTINNYTKNPKGDILQAINQLKQQLTSPTSSAEERWQALAFLTHFIGDLHQPLHVGRKTDRGGNDIKLKFMWKETNLHRVWDSNIINQQQLSYQEYVVFLKNQLTLKQTRQWQQGNERDWASESQGYRTQVYDFSMEKKELLEVHLKYHYLRKNLSLVNQRLTQAGLRLAYILNTTFK